MVSISVNEKVRVNLNTQCPRQYKDATVLRVYKESVQLLVSETQKKVTVALDRVCKLKKKTLTRTYHAVADSKFIDKRLGRYRKVRVVPVCFQPLQVMGNYQLMYNDPDIRKRGLFTFNDNTGQFEEHGLWPFQPQPAGGGNAIARLWQHYGDSIGIPTGPFRSLDAMYTCRLNWYEDDGIMHCAKDIIDEAVNREVRLLLDHQDKDTVYYSAESPESTRLGMGIFANVVGADVIDYISAQIQSIPARVQQARVSGVRP